MNQAVDEFFVVGGALRTTARSYVERPADRELRELAAAGRLCYVLTTRQMGKSSLMVRTAAYLQERGIHTATIDLTSIGKAPIDAWYLSVLDILQTQLSTAIDAEEWWKANASLAHVRRFTKFLQEVVANELDGLVTIFVDEIDSMLNLDFADDFFAAIRSVYNQEASRPDGPRISFVLLGVAAPNDLIKDQTRTPFNIGTRIQLGELTLAEARVFLEGLPGRNEAVLKRIFYWTNGHPYLTQAIGYKIADQGEREWSDSDIDDLVARLFLTDEAAVQENNLQFVRNRVLNSDNKEELLSLYRQVYGGKTVHNNEQSIYQNELKLYGLLRADEQDHLVVRNRIYRQVFDHNWIREHTPSSRWKVIVAVAAIAILLILGAYLIYRATMQTDDVLARSYMADFQGTANPTLRLDSLAKLFALDGHRDEALGLFNALPFEEKIALFEAVTPPTDVLPEATGTEPAPPGVADFTAGTPTIQPTATMASRPTAEYAALLPQVRLVAQETYQTLYTEDLNQAQDTTRLLQAMRDALEQGRDAESRALHDEIEIWLEARGYAAQGDYTSAKTTYDLAIRFGADNPATYLERALTSALLLEYEDAIDDLAVVWGRGTGWEQPVVNVLSRDEPLQEAVRNREAAPPFLERLPALPEPSIGTTQVVEQFGHLVFVSDRHGNDEIYLMSEDSNNVARLTNDPARDWAPAWSPDGERIVFVSERDGDMDLYLMDRDGSNVTNLTNNSKYDCCATWSPDGTQLVFNANGSDGPQDIFVIDADGTNLRQLTDDPAEDWGPDWSPDGEKIAFYSSRDGQAEIYVMNVDGTRQARLTRDAAADRSPTWSPDGRTIAFFSDRDGNFEIYVMNADGSAQSNLTENPADDLWPRWSPDGERIVFTSYRDRLAELYTIDVNDKAVTRLTDNVSEDLGASWHPR